MWVRPAPSGRRDSNSRPSPWQGDALPTEPRPHAPGLPPVRRVTIAEPAARVRSVQNGGGALAKAGHRASIEAVLTRPNVRWRDDCCDADQDRSAAHLDRRDGARRPCRGEDQRRRSWLGRRGRSVRGDQGHRGGAIRRSPSPRPDDPLSSGHGAPGSRSRAGTACHRPGPGRPRLAGGPDPDHLHRRYGAARLPVPVRAADVGRRGGTARAVAGHRVRRHRALAAQRARCSDGSEVDVVRGERARALVRPSSRCYRGDLPQHGRECCAKAPAATSSVSSAIRW